VAIDAAIRGVNLPATLSHAGLRHGIDVGLFLVRLRVEVPDLGIGNEEQTHPRKGECAENSQKESGYPFHMWSFTASSSCGFKNVGILAVRPSPKSIRPK
jgi:hypothetical protein